MALVFPDPDAEMVKTIRAYFLRHPDEVNPFYGIVSAEVQAAVPSVVSDSVVPDTLREMVEGDE